MRIRAYRSEDRDAVVSLHEELQSYERAMRASRAKGRDVSSQQIDEYEAMLASESNNACLLVAESDGALIGFVFFLVEGVFLEADPGQVYVQDLMVTAAARRMGVGRALMDSVRQFMAERGINRIDLQVLVGNEEARAFYSAIGFETTYLGLELDVVHADQG